MVNKVKDFDKNEIKSPIPTSNWALMILQRELCGFGDVDYPSVIYAQESTKALRSIYCDGEKLQDSDMLGKRVCVCGTLSVINDRKTKVGSIGSIQLTSNNDLIRITMWNEYWDKYSSKIKGNEGSLLIFSGEVKWDAFNSCHTVYSDKKTIVEVV
ncbi:MAG: OB-fold nucleic acid binding domain-containing protein [Acinetobacter sp.]|nr:OB-fold nucleic acid binding domain-containing protein [Acinetobacter sp.]